MTSLPIEAIDVSYCHLKENTVHFITWPLVALISTPASHKFGPSRLYIVGRRRFIAAGVIYVCAISIVGTCHWDCGVVHRYPLNIGAAIVLLGLLLDYWSAIGLLLDCWSAIGLQLSSIKIKKIIVLCLQCQNTTRRIFCVSYATVQVCVITKVSSFGQILGEYFIKKFHHPQLISETFNIKSIYSDKRLLKGRPFWISKRTSIGQFILRTSTWLVTARCYHFAPCCDSSVYGTRPAGTSLLLDERLPALWHDVVAL